MNPLPAPRYVENRYIDRDKWDHCIQASGNGLIYAYSDYLDHMALQWDALIVGDYETVMPLTWNKKWGIYYLYQPPFTASLGIFGQDIEEESVCSFLGAIPSRFRLVEIELNHGNCLAEPLPGMLTRTNLVLPLHEPYEKLIQAYRSNTRRECEKALAMGCHVVPHTPIHEIIDMAHRQMSRRKDPQRKALHTLELLYRRLEEKKRATTYGLYGPAGELLAGAVFFFSHQRIYYILAANTPASRGYKSSHCILNHVIRQYAGLPYTLDFEGSDIPGIAFFYRSFGAIPEHYPALRLNTLPYLIRWLKR